MCTPDNPRLRPGRDAVKASFLSEIFRSVAGESPGRVAIQSDTAEVSYAELDRWSDALMREIQSCGVEPFDRVGIVANRTVESICAVLAVLKVGGSYVPLDPAYPEQRLRYVLQDTGVRVVVGSGSLPLPSGEYVLIHPEESRERCRLVEPPADAAPRPLDAHALPAYVIHTSGSTGIPKGCVVTHANVSELLAAALPLFSFTAQDRWALFHSLCFDFSVWEMWGAFATGATLVLVPAHVAQSPDDLVRYLAAERVTVLSQVPSVFRYLTGAYRGLGAPPLSLRYVIFGGESVDVREAQEFVKLANGCSPTAVNMYGITEITVHATFKELTQSDFESSVRSPIGRPLPHLAIELRDESGNPVRPGETGEIWISGGGVAQGYLNRPDLTDATFVHEPAESAHKRYYRSGDLARYLPDGELEYVGRKDSQVKVLGFRIELGEVEGALRTIPAVRDVVVSLVRSRAGTPSLVACVWAADRTSENVLPGQLKKHAASVLPRHMLPSRYVVVDSFPMNPAGKVDRKAVADRIASARPAWN
ncbi:amino acid adenylation domain-containing protein [Streptomyces sp. NPDC088251]|uniref:amino acid adenylation domain-containing protein n=1 Tax=unclassified Streptomyces TaxID=2593676 RepID=UPI0037FE4104